jgi:hypothetical protein
MPTVAFARNPVNVNAALTVKAALTGSATSGDYTVTDAVSATANLLTVSIPAGSLTKEISFTPNPTLATAKSLVVTLLPDPESFLVDATHPAVTIDFTVAGGSVPTMTVAPATAPEGNSESYLLRALTAPQYAAITQPLFFGTNTDRKSLSTTEGLSLQLVGTAANPALNWHSPTKNPDLIALVDPPIVELTQTLTAPDASYLRYQRIDIAAIQVYMSGLGLRYLVCANYQVANAVYQGISPVPEGYLLVSLQRGHFVQNPAATTVGLFGEGYEIHAGPHQLGWDAFHYESALAANKYVLGFYIQIDMQNPNNTWFVPYQKNLLGGL